MTDQPPSPPASPSASTEPAVGVMIRSHAHEIVDALNADYMFLLRAQDPGWTKETLKMHGTQFSLVRQAVGIAPSDDAHHRYYVEEYPSAVGPIRLCSQWYEDQREAVITFLASLRHDEASRAATDGEAISPGGGMDDPFTVADLVRATSLLKTWYAGEWAKKVFETLEAAVMAADLPAGPRRDFHRHLDLLESTAEKRAQFLTPYDGFLEAPRFIADLYQLHRDAIQHLRQMRDEVLDRIAEDIARDAEPLLASITWRDLIARGATRTPPREQFRNPLDDW